VAPLFEHKSAPFFAIAILQKKCRKITDPAQRKHRENMRKRKPGERDLPHTGQHTDLEKKNRLSGAAGACHTPKNAFTCHSIWDT
jgi:hypothetical protein